MATIKKNKKAILVSSKRLLEDFQEATEVLGYDRISYGEWRKLKTSKSTKFVIIHSFSEYDLERLQIKEYDMLEKTFGETLYSYVCSNYGVTYDDNSLAAFLINNWKDYIPFDLETNIVKTSREELDLIEDTITYEHSPKTMAYQTTPTSSNNYTTTTSIDNYIQEWYNSNTTSMYDKILDQLDADGYITKTNNNEEKNNMNTNDLIKFDFGPVSDKQFRMSPYGIAVATNANGWVSYNPKTGEVFNVDIVNFDISKLIYKMPVALNAIAIGDILIHGNQPVFVRSINSNGTISVLNYANSTVVDILPVKSPFGFNFFTKVCALVDFSGLTADPDNPFGNMLPFLMLADDNKDFDPMTLLLLNSMGGNNNFVSNPMMTYFLLSQKGDKSNDMLPFLLMMNSTTANPLFGKNLNTDKVSDTPATT